MDGFTDGWMDSQAWRESLGPRFQPEFAILDADGGKGWDLVKKMVVPRKGSVYGFGTYNGPDRISVADALNHPFAR
jgi:hypothetical protein